MCSVDMHMEEKWDTLHPSLPLFFRGAARLLPFIVYLTSIVLLTLIILTPDGQGEISNKSRPLKPGEVGEWILLDGVCQIQRSPRPFPTTPA